MLWPGVCLGATAQYLAFKELLFTRSPDPLPSGAETQSGWAGLPDHLLHQIFKAVKGDLADGASSCTPRAVAPMSRAGGGARLFQTDGTAAASLRSVCRSWRRVHDTTTVTFLKPCALHAQSLITRFPSLEALDLSRCKYPDRADFTTVLGGLPRLASLTLKDAGAGPRFAATLAEALPGAVHLRTLNLSANGLAAGGAAVLADALRAGSCRLAEVNLRDNLIDSKGGAALAAALRHNRSVTDLDLSANAIGMEGAVALSGALVHNSSLRRLNLGGCSLGDDGCQALAQSLATFPSLTSLSVYSNGLTDRGAVELAAAAGANSNALAALELRGNPGITWVGLEALIRAAEANPQLVSIQADSPRVNGGWAVRARMLAPPPLPAAGAGGPAAGAGGPAAGPAAAGAGAEAGGGATTAEGMGGEQQDAEQDGPAREAAALVRLAKLMEARAMERAAFAAAGSTL